MTIELNNIIPWGRSFNEYVDMFNLDESDLNKKILGCGDGPANFNSIMHIKGKMATSIDPLYNFRKENIEERINQAKDEIKPQLYNSLDNYNWHTYKNPEELITIRLKIMSDFINDYEIGKTEGRYLPYSLPLLPFKNYEFELSLCSYLLFAFKNLGFEFHYASIVELLRVSEELRIFPLVDLNGNSIDFIDALINKLEENHFKVTISKSKYAFQKKADTVMIIT